jgi:DNA helicase HerA-like ATPase
LGVLGIGKTSLAVQLIRRMIMAGVKVVVLDVTRRYAVEFRDIYSDAWEATVAAKVADLVAREPSTAPTKLVAAFLAGRSRLLIVNPADFLSVSRATLAQAAKDFAEALLALARDENAQADPDHAKYCLVLEEAHSLVPETNSVIDRSEINFVNATARAVLQGRKYGMGTLLITQRSANVAKSILNQCNTMFGMRMYDDTGIGFLSNYVGSGYADLLPTLAAQRVIAFGRGVRCAAPVVLDVYDSKLFRDNFWTPRLMEIPLPGTHPNPGPNPTVEETIGGGNDSESSEPGPDARSLTG